MKHINAYNLPTILALVSILACNAAAPAPVGEKDAPVIYETVFPSYPDGEKSTQEPLRQRTEEEKKKSLDDKLTLIGEAFERMIQIANLIATLCGKDDAVGVGVDKECFIKSLTCSGKIKLEEVGPGGAIGMIYACVEKAKDAS